MLESNDPSTWMENITIAELCRNGGSPDPINRLYQLFIEGKGKYTLLFDSDMYKVAAVREDLFSTKQCKELAIRGEEVYLREKKEEEEVAVNFQCVIGFAIRVNKGNNMKGGFDKKLNK